MTTAVLVIQILVEKTIGSRRRIAVELLALLVYAVAYLSLLAAFVGAILAYNAYVRR